AGSVAAARRRRRAILRRSRSEVRPHTPWSMPLRRAYSRQGPLTGHSAQILRASSTPTPSLGKNTDGASVRHRPLAIHGSDMSLLAPSPSTAAGLRRFPSLTTFQRVPDDAVWSTYPPGNHSKGGGVGRGGLLPGGHCGRNHPRASGAGRGTDSGGADGRGIHGRGTDG